MSESDITQLLELHAGGRSDAFEQLLPIVYDELRRMAKARRRQNPSYQTLNTTAVVHEVFLKLAGKQDAAWENRTHFFRIASRAMRDVLVDYARAKRSAKRGGNQVIHPLDEAGDIADIKSDEVVAVHEALDTLEKLSPQQCKIVELRYFVGLTIAEVADVLEISEATVKRNWTTARAWLQRAIENER